MLRMCHCCWHLEARTGQAGAVPSGVRRTWTPHTEAPCTAPLCGKSQLLGSPSPIYSEHHHCLSQGGWAKALRPPLWQLAHLPPGEAAPARGHRRGSGSWPHANFTPPAPHCPASPPLAAWSQGKPTGFALAPRFCQGKPAGQRPVLPLLAKHLPPAS